MLVDAAGQRFVAPINHFIASEPKRSERSVLAAVQPFPRNDGKPARLMNEKVESLTVPVIEEELKLGRETVETGRVRVRTVPEERLETVSSPLLRTEVLVERIPMEEEADGVPPVRDEGETIVVPVVEERLVKKLFLVEEVRLSRRASAQDVDQQIKLRSQRVSVEREESSGAQQSKE
jgi:uncharacterized protein (TIGR02271 family)